MIANRSERPNFSRNRIMWWVLSRAAIVHRHGNRRPAGAASEPGQPNGPPIRCRGDSCDIEQNCRVKWNKVSVEHRAMTMKPRDLTASIRQVDNARMDFRTLAI